MVIITYLQRRGWGTPHSRSRGASDIKEAHRKIWKLNVVDDKDEEIKWKLSGFLRDNNFSFVVFTGLLRGKILRRFLVDSTAIKFYDLCRLNMSFAFIPVSSTIEKGVCREPEALNAVIDIIENSHRVLMTNISSPATDSLRLLCGSMSFGRRCEEDAHV